MSKADAKAEVEALQAFAEDLRQEVLQRAEYAEQESLKTDAFTAVVTDDLIQAGEFDQVEVCHHKARGIQVDGYSVNEDEDRLDLIVTIHTDNVPPQTVDARTIEDHFKRLRGFLEKALEGYHEGLEESSPQFDMALRIHELRASLKKVRFFLLTDGITKAKERPRAKLDALTVSYEVWDLVRVFRCVSSGQAREAIEVDFVERFGEPIPCLQVPVTNAEYGAFMAIIPGNVLAELYEEFGDRMLERNVRAFLQARGKVNKGIRETILNAPHRFLAYNNGISATAADVKLAPANGGGLGIKRISDLQIVNGGQTTASLRYAMKKDGADVSKVFVQAKLSVVDPQKLEEIVPLISRYANSQNKVSEPDFSANDPFHVKLESLSRTIWAPPHEGSPRQTRWFYERARGQYQVARAAVRGKGFTDIHPPAQKFTKTDVAKFQHSWERIPHFVSRGAEKNFREFMIRLQDARFELDPDYFQRLVAKAILFRRTERLVHERNFGGYRANIVTYTIAFLAEKTSQRIDLSKIWHDQALSEALETAIIDVANAVHASIINPPGSQNVTEWCKREECWRAIRVLDVSLPEELEDELVPINKDDDDEGPASDAEVARIAAVTPGQWSQMLAWAKETKNLSGKERQFLTKLGDQAARRQPISRGQATNAVRLIDSVDELGFTLETVGDGLAVDVTSV